MRRVLKVEDLASIKNVTTSSIYRVLKTRTLKLKQAYFEGRGFSPVIVVDADEVLYLLSTELSPSLVKGLKEHIEDLVRINSRTLKEYNSNFFEDLATKYLMGEFIGSLAEDYNVSPQSIRRVLLCLGVKIQRGRRKLRK